MGDISERCRPPDRVPVYGYVTMSRTGFERCLVERRYVTAFKSMGFVVTDPVPDCTDRPVPAPRA